MTHHFIIHLPADSFREFFNKKLDIFRNKD